MAASRFRFAFFSYVHHAGRVSLSVLLAPFSFERRISDDRAHSAAPSLTVAATNLCRFYCYCYCYYYYYYYYYFSTGCAAITSGGACTSSSSTPSPE